MGKLAAGEFGDRLLWRFVDRLANLSVIVQLALILLPLVIGGFILYIALLEEHLLVSVVLSLAFLPAGVMIGSLAVHPFVSRALIRRQSTVETIKYDVYARFDGRSGRVPDEWDQVRTIRALVEGLDHFDVYFGYGQSSHAVDFEVVEGGELGETFNQTAGRWYKSVYFDPLRKGETHRIHLRLRIPDDGEECPPFCTVTPTHLTQNLSIELVFAGERPTGCWATFWLSDASRTAIRERVLRPDGRGLVRYTQRRTKPGHRYGITWEWPTRATAVESSIQS